MLLDDAAIVPVYQRGRAYLQRDSIKNMYNHKYGGDLSFKWASVENKKKQVIACFFFNTFVSYKCLFPPTWFQPDCTSKLLLTNFIFSFSTKELFADAICNDTNQCCYSDDEGSNRNKINKKSNHLKTPPLPVCMFIV